MLVDTSHFKKVALNLKYYFTKLSALVNDLTLSKSKENFSILLTILSTFFSTNTRMRQLYIFGMFLFSIFLRS